jgi:hypothetical protein
LLLLLLQTTAQFEEEVAAIPTAAAEAYNPFEQPYSAGEPTIGSSVTGCSSNCIMSRRQGLLTKWCPVFLSAQYSFAFQRQRQRQGKKAVAD